MSLWNKDASQVFIDFGRYFVPDRELQIEIVCDLIAPRHEPFHVIDLCCGEGLLAGALLERFPSSTVHGYDGAQEMLTRAMARLAPYGERFQPGRIELHSSDWRNLDWPVGAVVSSLAIHHLDGSEKQDLFRDVARMLMPGGEFVIADLVEPVHARGVDIAARTWDAAVRERAEHIDGNLAAFEFFQNERWNLYRFPDPEIDKPSPLLAQLTWLGKASFVDVDVYWMRAGHAIYGGRKPTR